MKIRVLEKCTFATVSVTVSRNLKVFFLMIMLISEKSDIIKRCHHFEDLLNSAAQHFPNSQLSSHNHTWIADVFGV